MNENEAVVGSLAEAFGVNGEESEQDARYGFVDEAIRKAQEHLAHLKELAGRGEQSRRLSVAATRLDDAALWLGFASEVPA